MWTKIKNFILDLLFPKICFVCQREEDYFCRDCQSLLEISGFHKKQRMLTNLSDLYFACSYKNPLIKNLIHYFKYEPFVKELGKPLSFLIITHFKLMDNKPSFLLPKTSAFVVLPVPLEKKKLKSRGFNQAEVLAKELAIFFKIPLISNCLIKTNKTPSQAELNNEQRKENVKGAFSIEKESLIKNKNILLIDDVYTTGATMQECARVLKEAGARKIIGIVLAKG